MAQIMGNDDLISRAAAITEVEEWAEHGQEIIHWTGIKAMLEVQPPIDAAPVVHAKWQGVSPFVDSEECSECRYNIQSKELRTPRCPWCGAIMDGWDEEKLNEEGSL